MAWNAWQLEFEILSPIHIGYHKIANLQRTRYYVPGKNLWGSVTSLLTQRFQLEDYEKVGKFLKKNLIFSYFYLKSEKEGVFYPHYEDTGLNYGSLPKDRFEKECLSSCASTAIKAESSTAEEGTLHEIEILLPRRRLFNGKTAPLLLIGVICVRTEGDSNDILNCSIENGEPVLKNNNHSLKLFEILKEGIPIGGERRYGFGKIRLKREQVQNIPDGNPVLPGLDKIKIRLSKEKPEVDLEFNTPILSHIPVGIAQIKGDIEALVGREWTTHSGAGKRLSKGDLFWCPGSIVIGRESFVVRDYGIWDMTNYDKRN